MSILNAVTNSHPGRATLINEDCFLTGGYVPDSFSMETSPASIEYKMSDSSRQTVCFAVFAGNGGKMAAKVAAQIAAEQLLEEVPRLLLLPLIDVEPLMQRYGARVHDQIMSSSKLEKTLSDMGAAFACICLRGEQAVVFNFGGCQVYQYRVGHLKKMTTDQPQQNYFGQPDRKVKITCAASIAFPVRDNDRFLICSPGLAKYVDESKIKDCLETPDLQHSARQLISLALERVNSESITATVVSWSAKDLERGPATDLSDPEKLGPAHEKIAHAVREMDKDLRQPKDKIELPPARKFDYWQHFPVWVGYLGLALAVLIGVLIWYSSR